MHEELKLRPSALARKSALVAACLLPALLGGWGSAADFETREKLTVRGGILVSTSATASPLIFASSITAQGNVGIANTSPATKLHVTGTLDADDIACPTCTGMQMRVTGSCGVGNQIRQINQNGSVVCDVVSPPSSTREGSLAEGRAAAFLEAAGLVVTERRWRGAGGEIDLVARDGETVVFVEVKARSSEAFGAPEEAVDRAKRRRLTQAASWYLARRGLTEAPARFDVVAVDPVEIRHLPDAFRL